MRIDHAKIDALAATRVEACVGWRSRLPKQRRIAIVGTASDSMRLAPFDDPTWQIWVMNFMGQGAAPRWDVLFELHDHVFETAGTDLAWLKCQTKPLVVKPGNATIVPAAVPLPKDELLDEFGNYFSSTVAWMLAMAILLKPDEIGIWGVNMAHDTEYASQRPDCEGFIRIARERAIPVTLPAASDLNHHAPLYGFDTPTLKKLRARRAGLEQLLAAKEAELNAAHRDVIAIKASLVELGLMERFLA